MNELQFIQYKHELRMKEKNSGKVLWLATYSCFIYMLFASFNITGKMFITQTYLYVYSEGMQHYINYKALTLANVQWFFYQIVAPLSLPILPHLIGRMKFRFILLVASLGPIFFLLPALYVSGCGTQDEGICNLGVIYVIAIIISIISGLFQSILLFAMLYYIANISNNHEKIIYYGSFYFIHSFQWLFGSLIGDLLVNYVVKPNAYEAILHIYVILSICEIFVCLLYLSLPEEDQQTRFKYFKSSMQNLMNPQNNTQKKDSKSQLRELLLNSQYQENDDENDMEEDETKLLQQQTTQLALIKSQDEIFKKSLSFMTLQCFSIEENDFQEILQPSQNCKNNRIINFKDYKNNSYLGNLLLTYNSMKEEGFPYMVILIFNTACIEAFLMLFFAAFSVYPETISPKIQAQIVYQAYLYVGIGELFGCFGMGLFGDFKDKLLGLYFQLGVFQFGCFIAWSSYIFEYEILVMIFACTLGFCDSALTSSTISFQVCEFSKVIYMNNQLIFLVDLMYFLYSCSFSIAALLYTICNYTNTYVSLIILQISGIAAIYATYKIKNNSILRMKLST